MTPKTSASRLQIGYCILFLLFPFLAIAQDSFNDNIVDNIPVSPIDNYILVALLLGIYFAYFFLNHTAQSKQKTKTMLFNTITINRKSNFMKKLIILLAIFTTFAATAQSVGINTDGSAANASAMLDVSSTTKGFLPPRMTTTQRDLLTSPATGLVLFNTTTNGLEIKSSTSWISLKTSSDAVFLPTIVIGTQQWMEKNLEVVTYRNGDIIPQVTDATTWAGLTTGAWCYYNNDVANGAIYGKLYNWYAVNDSRGLAPQGWHVPTDTEWTTLTDKLGGATSVAGGKMKSVGTTKWTTPNTSATNESGFSGLPAGYCDDTGPFFNIGNYGFWWSSSVYDSSKAWSRVMSSNLGTVTNPFNIKAGGFSVRCLRD